MPPAVNISWSQKQVDDWQTANRKPSSNHAAGDTIREERVHRGRPPDEGCFKVNVDASVVEGHNSFALGMVLRDDHGPFAAGKTMQVAGNVSVMEAELTGILEALIWAKEMTEGKVMIEGDSLLSVTAIKQGQCNLLEIGDLLQQCDDLLSGDGRFSINHVKKQANKVAHSLARYPCELNGFIFFSSPPSILLETLLLEDLIY